MISGERVVTAFNAEILNNFHDPLNLARIVSRRLTDFEKTINIIFDICKIFIHEKKMGIYIYF